MLAYIIVAVIIALAIGGWILSASADSEVAAAVAPPDPPAAPQEPPPPKYVGPLNKPQIAAAGIGNNEIVRCPNDGAIAQIIRGYRMAFPTMKAWEAQGRPAYRDIPCDLFYAIPNSDHAYGEVPVVRL